MNNFKIDNPTVVHFGKDVVNDLGKTVALYGKKVMLVYGMGSIKKNGIYDAVIRQLKSIQAEVYEFDGIKPNPIVEDVNEAAEMGRRNKVDVILAVGGGSVIDSAKVMSVCIPNHTSAWRVMIRLDKPKKATPLIAVLTLAATGTEMNGAAVLTKEEANKKIGFVNRLMFPKHSFLDPQYTVSVPKNYTAYGVVDLMAHAMENYFGKGEATLSDRFVFSILNEAIAYGPALLEDLENYELREKIMFAAAMALSGITVHGRESGDWGIHSLGHNLSALFDTPHGATLSIVYPAWLKYLNDKMPDRIAQLGKAVFNTNDPEVTTAAIENFFRQVGSPVRMQEAGIGPDKKELIIQTMVKNKSGGNHFKFNEDDIRAMVDLMYAD
jgi:alcohol dehydrogenase YqhD (iron-dependent ADH family)